MGTHRESGSGASGATLTLMEHAGVLISIVSKSAGTTTPPFTQRTYVHANTEDLSQGRKVPAAFTRSPSNRERTGLTAIKRVASHTREMTLTYGYVARSEGLEPPTF